MVLGATTASPRCTWSIAETRIFQGRVLEEKPARTGLERVVGVFVEVEGGQNQHSRTVTGSVTGSVTARGPGVLPPPRSSAASGRP